MIRTTLGVLCILAGSLNAFAQLPSQNGQVWREYVVSVPIGNTKTFDNVRGTIEDAPTTIPIVEYIRRETGEAAWTGENFGLISCDGQKVYVYHVPAMQQRVAEIVGRFMRQETRNVQFVTEAHFLTISERISTEKGFTDVREPVYQYLHPVVTSDGKPGCKTAGVSAYWVAKDDITKLYDKLKDVWDITLSDSGSNILRCPKITTYNGQPGSIQDIAKSPFVTDVVSVQKDSGKEYKPIISIFDEGQTIRMFSLLSWDRRTATTDVSAMFSKIAKVDLMNCEQPASDEKKLQIPRLQKIELTEHNLIWPVDGMLIVFLGGIERRSEVRAETGTPILNKIPYINKKFSNSAIGRTETVSIHGIITVKMVENSPQTTQQNENVNAAR